MHINSSPSCDFRIDFGNLRQFERQDALEEAVKGDVVARCDVLNPRNGSVHVINAEAPKVVCELNKATILRVDTYLTDEEYKKFLDVKVDNWKQGNVSQNT
jgi:hypothetical protein